MHEDLELSKFLNQFEDVFIDDIPGELPSKQGDDDHAIELLPEDRGFGNTDSSGAGNMGEMQGVDTEEELSGSLLGFPSLHHLLAAHLPPTALKEASRLLRGYNGRDLVPPLQLPERTISTGKDCKFDVQDHQSLAFFDPGARANFITPQLAEKMGIKTDEMGPAYTASMAAPGLEVAVTDWEASTPYPVYVGHEEFFIMPLEGCDVLLGMRWFYNHKAVLDSFNKTLRLSSYVIYVKERDGTELSNLSSLDVSQRAFLDKYADCFSEALSGQLPPERPEDHNIDLIPGSAAPNKPPYRVRAAQQEEIMTQLNELLQKGHIQPSSSPFCSPVLLAQKKDKSWRMCIDYRALNKITMKNKIPIPRIDGVLDRLQGASFFNRIDLKSGYHHIRVNPADVPKTAFRTTFGLYEFLVMPFGLTNAPATFNHMMDIIFRPLRHCVGTLFDNMIVLSRSEAEHMEHLRVVAEEKIGCQREEE
ncbi:hypothetical protein L7F22_008703 [Adiantum nelumboides]|nr:hypothetical protein [Adiantum nelumboides]